MNFHEKRREQARHAIYPCQPTGLAKKKTTYISDNEMELVGSHHGISDAYDPEGKDSHDSGQEDQKRPLAAVTERRQVVELALLIFGCLRSWI